MRRNRVSRKKKNRIMGKMVEVALILSLAFWFVIGYHKLDTINKKYKGELEKLTEEVEDKRRELNMKKEEMNYYQTDKNIERIAREEAGLVKQNELVFIQTE